MKLLLSLLLTALLASPVLAQSDDPRADRVHNAMDSDIVAYSTARQAGQSVVDANLEMAHLHADDTKDVVQYYADKARNRMRGVDATLKQAEDEAGWSQWWANQAGCDDATGHAAEAVDGIHSLRATWMEAFDKLAQGTGDQDAETLLGYLATAYNDIKEGMDALRVASASLETARADLKDCYPAAFAGDDSSDN